MQIKLRAKTLMRRIDEQTVDSIFDKSTYSQHVGYVQESVFFEVLSLLKVKLSELDEDLIKKRFRHPCEARIDYK